EVLPGQRVEWSTDGSPTEAALLVLAWKMGVRRKFFASRWNKLVHHPFDSTVKMMTMVYSTNDYLTEEGEAPSTSIISFTKGAPERILPRCVSYQNGDEIEAMSEEFMQKVKDMNDSMA